MWAAAPTASLIEQVEADMQACEELSGPISLPGSDSGARGVAAQKLTTMQRKAILDRLLAERMSQPASAAHPSRHALPPEKRHELVQDLLAQRRRRSSAAAPVFELPQPARAARDSAVTVRPSTGADVLTRHGELLSPTSSMSNSEAAGARRVQPRESAGGAWVATGDDVATGGNDPGAPAARVPGTRRPPHAPAARLQSVMERLDLNDGDEHANVVSDRREHANAAQPPPRRAAGQQLLQHLTAAAGGGPFEVDTALFDSFSSHADTRALQSFSLHGAGSYGDDGVDASAHSVATDLHYDESVDAESVAHEPHPLDVHRERASAAWAPPAAAWGAARRADAPGRRDDALAMADGSGQRGRRSERDAATEHAVDGRSPHHTAWLAAPDGFRGGAAPAPGLVQRTQVQAPPHRSDGWGEQMKGSPGAFVEPRSPLRSGEERLGRGGVHSSPSHMISPDVALPRLRSDHQTQGMAACATLSSWQVAARPRTAQPRAGSHCSSHRSHDDDDASSDGPQSHVKTQSPNRHSKKAVLDEITKERDRELTFKPQLCERSKRVANRKVSSGRRRIEELSRPRTLQEDKYRRIRQEAEMAELAECSFAPQLVSRQRAASATRLSGRVVAESDAAAPEDAAERLHHAHDHVTSARDRKRALAQQEQLSECTFKPQINNKHLDAATYRPIHDRVSEVVREKKERLARTRLQEELTHPDMTFAPAINQRSVKLAQAREVRQLKQSLCFLHSGGGGGPESPGPKRSRSADGPDHRECSFAPAINSNTEDYLENTDIPADFAERQRYFERRRQAKQQWLAEQTADPECTFQPAIGPNAAIWLASSAKAASLQETREEFDLRLAGEGQRKQIALQAIDNMLMSKYTFHPRINVKSRKLARSKGVDELHLNEAQKAAQEEARAAAEQRLAQECTFAPDTRKPLIPNANYLPAHAAFTIHDQPVEQLVQRIADYQQSKAQRLEEVRNKRQYEELKDCTFTPAVNKGAPKPAGRVLVRGLASHLDKVNAAKSKQEALKKRREEVFLENPKARTSSTIPQPFALSDNHPVVHLKKAQLRQQLIQESMKECTFKPHTNEAAKREIIDKLLSTDTPFSCL